MYPAVSKPAGGSVGGPGAALTFGEGESILPNCACRDQVCLPKLLICISFSLSAQRSSIVHLAFRRTGCFLERRCRPGYLRTTSGDPRAPVRARVRLREALVLEGLAGRRELRPRVRA